MTQKLTHNKKKKSPGEVFMIFDHDVTHDINVLENFMNSICVETCIAYIVENVYCTYFLY